MFLEKDEQVKWQSGLKSHLEELLGQRQKYLDTIASIKSKESQGVRVKDTEVPLDKNGSVIRCNALAYYEAKLNLINRDISEMQKTIDLVCGVADEASLSADGAQQ